MVAPLTLHKGLTIGRGITFGAGTGAGGGGGVAGVDNVTGYDQMPGPVMANQIIGGQLQDITATVNDPVGFTINNDTQTGIAITNLSASNQAFFATYGTGFHTCTWGPGSTAASSVINVIDIFGSNLIFDITDQLGPATYNYPFTFS